MDRSHYPRDSVFPVKYLRKETGPVRDACYDHLKLDIATGRALGLLLFSRNDNGEYTTSYLSSWMLYSLAIFSAVCYFWYFTLNELIGFTRGSRVHGSYLLFILLFSHLLPVTFLAEAKKLNEYLNKWFRFQREYRVITGTRLDFPCRKFKISLLAGKLVLFGLLMVMLQCQFPTATITTKLLVIYYYWLGSFLTNFWFMIIYYLHWTARIIQKLTMGVVRNRGVKMTMADVEALWVDLYKLGKATGQTFCFTYCYFILFLFLALVVTAYETLVILVVPVTYEEVIFLFMTLIIALYMASIPLTSQVAVKKMGEEYYKLLWDLKIKERHPPRMVQEIDALIQAISDNQPSIDLGGFVTLDNSLVTSLMATMVTYLIVLVQFKI